MLKDNELVQIGGFNVYSTPEREKVDFNDGSYICCKKEPKNPQYAVFVNETTGEAVLAFNGTDKGEGDDLRTDFQLGGKGVPPMHEKALEIYHKLKNQYNIVALCGNSLGGSLANYVAINTGIRSVTINPAVLPNDPNVNFKKDYDNNITNYIATEDPLDKGQTGLGIKNSQMPGKCVTINFGYAMEPISNFSPFLASHVGYVNGIDDDLSKSKLVMPDGYTNIYINAADYVNINPFTGKNAGETDDSFEIEINSDNFKLMSQEINQILSETQQSKVYIEQVVSIAQNYNFIKTIEKRVELYFDFIKTEIINIPWAVGVGVCEGLLFLARFDFPLELFVDSLRYVSNTALKVLDFVGADKWARPIYCLLEFGEGLISFVSLVQELADFINLSGDLLFGIGLDRDLFVQNLLKASLTLQNNANILDQKLNTLKNQNDDMISDIISDSSGYDVVPSQITQLSQYIQCETIIFSQNLLRVGYVAMCIGETFKNSDDACDNFVTKTLDGDAWEKIEKCYETSNMRTNPYGIEPLKDKSLNTLKLDSSKVNAINALKTNLGNFDDDIVGKRFDTAFDSYKSKMQGEFKKSLTAICRELISLPSAIQYDNGEPIISLWGPVLESGVPENLRSKEGDISLDKLCQVYLNTSFSVFMNTITTAAQDIKDNLNHIDQLVESMKETIRNAIFYPDYLESINNNNSISYNTLITIEKELFAACAMIDDNSSASLKKLKQVINDELLIKLRELKNSYEIITTN